MELVTVIIPTYQRKMDVLSRALKSVLYQTYENIEILLIDDNKSDSYSIEIINLVEKLRDERIKLVKNDQNIGGALSRNKGIKIAKGSYISFLDDDDFYLKNKIEKQVEFMKQNKCDFVISDLAIVNQNIKLQDVRSHKWLKKNRKNEKIIINHYKYHFTGTPTFLFNRNPLIDCGGFPDVKMGHEFHLVCNLLEKGYKLGYLDEILTIAVAHDGERVSNKKNRQKELTDLLDFKMGKIEEMDMNDKRRIYYRHNLASSFDYLNKNEKIAFLKSVIKAIYYSPNGFMAEFIKRIVIKINSRSIENEKK
ncbi:glycosyltransferase family 2 protein [Mammaliicoccus sciuri]|uniref:glycosyltransferase family 2 protein n=1 Tax=Mammaliicoccus sciuri TaxID=1296 RepID=UPI001C1E1654|nr:glycosyltransferase family 2 protein [Mammaliicoccus sciuri]MBU6087733.1 glycosyltransferase [Mammaliicoccus sciuri]MBW3108713.1 glycosyltransferase [Mammaliicoccus sciuri]WQL17168.1 glycosyltransferase family 2 protein [Mammaliicoccus sciuri]